jgi:hypothetical protein
MGDHVWLMTSKQTEPLLDESTGLELRIACTDTPAQFIDIRMEDFVHKADTG